MSDLANLKVERRVIKASITRLQNNIESASNDKIALQTDLKSINILYDRYNAVQLSIEQIKFAEVDIDEEIMIEESDRERGKVDDQRRFIVNKINFYLDSLSQTQTTDVNIALSRTTDESSGCVLNLKPIPLPTFEGNHTSWMSFYESFQVLVGNNRNLSNINKFHYLKGCLKDGALRAIESLPLSGDNYLSAIDVLRKRYENRRLIVQEHVAGILSIKNIVKESHLELRTLVDTVTNNIAALKALKIETTNWDPLLVPIILEKLDFVTKREWQATLDKELPSFEVFIDFLKKRIQIVEAMSSLKYDNSSVSNFRNGSKPFYKNQMSKPIFNSGIKHEKFNTNITSSLLACYICKEAHTVFQCKKLLDLSVANRINKINELNLCTNCLRKHDFKNCKSSSSCKECRQKHHSLLHVPIIITRSVPTPSSSALTLLLSETNRILFSTVVLLVSDNKGNFFQCRAVLDQCSEVCVISETLCKKLKLFTRASNVLISGVNVSNNEAKRCWDVTIKSRVSNFSAGIQCYVLPKITRSTPAISFDRNIIKLPPGVALADDKFNISREVDLLLGAEWFWKLLIGAPIQLHKNQPFFQETLFGWIVSGSVELSNNDQFSCNIISKESDLEAAVANFLNVEQVAETSLEPADVNQCETFFQQTTVRDISGKFVVKLPFKNPINMGDSKAQALRRLFLQEKRLAKDEKLANAYKEFMSDYLKMGHAEEVPFSTRLRNEAFYLPHIPVFKQTADGPKIRIVFDCAAQSSNGLSLNDNLITGENLQRDLFDILCKFRMYKFAIAGDINKMYRMIKINADDVDYLRFFWRNNTRESIKTYRLTTLTFGLTCAPYIAIIRCSRQLADSARETFPNASKVISQNFYMDDLLVGSNSIDELVEIKTQVLEVLSKAGFNLCKWSANDSRVVATSGDNLQLELSKTRDVKILGFWWNCCDDELGYKTNNEFNCKVISKRNILSAVAKIFDPLGLINPVIVKAKIILQKIWVLKLTWDEAVPKEIETEWTQFLAEVPELSNFRVPRNVIIEYVIRVELHGFADASIKSLGAAIYVKSVNRSGEASVSLLCAKSKVAPIKKVTLPRLELNAAFLLCKLMTKVKASLNINTVFYWTDSTIAVESYIHLFFDKSHSFRIGK